MIVALSKALPTTDSNRQQPYLGDDDLDWLPTLHWISDMFFTDHDAVIQGNYVPTIGPPTIRSGLNLWPQAVQVMLEALFSCELNADWHCALQVGKAMIFGSQTVRLSLLLLCPTVLSKQ